MAIEQGLNFTVIEAPHPLEDLDPEAIAAYKGERDFYFARRVWLGWVPGTDWLHDAIEREFGEDNVWYDVRSRRDATHVGAAGEVATVVLLLMGVAAIEFARRFGGKLGDRSADDIYEWVKGLAKQRREERGLEHADPPPNFASGWEAPDLAERLISELADIMRVPATELELVGFEAQDDKLSTATYRLSATGAEYTAEVGTDFVDFRRVGAEVPERREVKKRFWQR